MKNAPCFLYIPVPSFAVGRDLAYGLVESRKVACVNIIPGMVSIYCWEGKIEEIEEAVLLVKTLEHARDEVNVYAKPSSLYLPCYPTAHSGLPTDDGASIARDFTPDRAKSISLICRKTIQNGFITEIITNPWDNAISRELNTSIGRNNE